MITEKGDSWHSCYWTKDPSIGAIPFHVRNGFKQGQRAEQELWVGFMEQKWDIWNKGWNRVWWPVGWEGWPESSRSDGIYLGTDPKVEHILIDGPHWKRPHTPLERSTLSWKGQDFRIRPTWVQVLISFLTGFVSFNTLHTFSWYFTLSCLRSKVNRLLIKDGRLNTSINLSHLSRCHYSPDKVVFVYLLWHKLIKD